MEKVRIKQATQKGYIECAVGRSQDWSDISMITMETPIVYMMAKPLHVL